MPEPNCRAPETFDVFQCARMIERIAHGGHRIIPDEIVRCEALLIQINERPSQER